MGSFFNRKKKPEASVAEQLQKLIDVLQHPVNERGDGFLDPKVYESWDSLTSFVETIVNKNQSSFLRDLQPLFAWAQDAGVISSAQCLFALNSETEASARINWLKEHLFEALLVHVRVLQRIGLEPVKKIVYGATSAPDFESFEAHVQYVVGQLKLVISKFNNNVGVPEASHRFYLPLLKALRQVLNLPDKLNTDIVTEETPESWLDEQVKAIMNEWKAAQPSPAAEEPTDAASEEAAFFAEQQQQEQQAEENQRAMLNAHDKTVSKINPEDLKPQDLAVFYEGLLSPQFISPAVLDERKRVAKKYHAPIFKNAFHKHLKEANDTSSPEKIPVPAWQETDPEDFQVWDADFQESLTAWKRQTAFLEHQVEKNQKNPSLKNLRDLLRAITSARTEEPYSMHYAARVFCDDVTEALPFCQQWDDKNNASFPKDTVLKFVAKTLRGMANELRQNPSDETTKKRLIHCIENLMKSPGEQPAGEVALDPQDFFPIILKEIAAPVLQPEAAQLLPGEWEAFDSDTERHNSIEGLVSTFQGVAAAHRQIAREGARASDVIFDSLILEGSQLGNDGQKNFLLATVDACMPLPANVSDAAKAQCRRHFLAAFRQQLTRYSKLFSGVSETGIVELPEDQVLSDEMFIAKIRNEFDAVVSASNADSPVHQKVAALRNQAQALLAWFDAPENSPAETFKGDESTNRKEAFEQIWASEDSSWAQFLQSKPSPDEVFLLCRMISTNQPELSSKLRLESGFFPENLEDLKHVLLRHFSQTPGDYDLLREQFYSFASKLKAIAETCSPDEGNAEKYQAIYALTSSLPVEPEVFLNANQGSLFYSLLANQIGMAERFKDEKLSLAEKRDFILERIKTHHRRLLREDSSLQSNDLLWLFQAGSSEISPTLESLAIAQQELATKSLEAQVFNLDLVHTRKAYDKENHPPQSKWRLFRRKKETSSAEDEGVDVFASSRDWLQENTIADREEEIAKNTVHYFQLKQPKFLSVEDWSKRADKLLDLVNNPGKFNPKKFALRLKAFQTRLDRECEKHVDAIDRARDELLADQKLPAGVSLTGLLAAYQFMKVRVLVERARLLLFSQTLQEHVAAKASLERMTAVVNRLAVAKDNPEEEAKELAAYTDKDSKPQFATFGALANRAQEVYEERRKELDQSPCPEAYQPKQTTPEFWFDAEKRATEAVKAFIQRISAPLSAASSLESVAASDGSTSSEPQRDSGVENDSGSSGTTTPVPATANTLPVPARPSDEVIQEHLEQRLKGSFSIESFTPTTNAVTGEVTLAVVCVSLNDPTQKINLTLTDKPKKGGHRTVSIASALAEATADAQAETTLAPKEISSKDSALLLKAGLELAKIWFPASFHHLFLHERDTKAVLDEQITACLDAGISKKNISVVARSGSFFHWSNIYSVPEWRAKSKDWFGTFFKLVKKLPQLLSNPSSFFQPASKKSKVDQPAIDRQKFLEQESSSAATTLRAHQTNRKPRSGS